MSAVATAANRLVASSKRLAEMFAHRMQPGAPVPDDRVEWSQNIFREWLESGGESELQAIAAKKFPSSQFECFRSRPVFAEHEVPRKDEDGETSVEVYDRSALEAIARKCNERILDTGDFAPLIEGHTPNSEEGNQPDVLGYAGPFRVGLIGNVKPRWCIFCDEWWDKRELEKLRKLQRRSPEVWLTADINDRILDPIACLGAETPRLDLGLTKFCRTASGQIVEKYSAVFSAEGNTFAPALASGSKEKHSRTGEGQMLQPEDIKQIVEAIMQTKAMKWVASQMESEGGQEPDGDEGEPIDPVDDEVDDDMDDADPPAPAKPADPDLANDDELGSMKPEEREDYERMDESCRKAYMKGRRYSMQQTNMPGDDDMGQNNSPIAKAQYSRLASENAELKGRVKQLEDQSRHKDRYHRLQTLSQSHAFDLDEELKDVKDIPQDAFDKHCKRIVDRYQKRDSDTEIPYVFTEGEKRSSASIPQATVEKYHREALAVAQRKGVDYDEAKRDVYKSHGVEL